MQNETPIGIAIVSLAVGIFALSYGVSVLRAPANVFARRALLRRVLPEEGRLSLRAIGWVFGLTLVSVGMLLLILSAGIAFAGW